MDFPRYVFTSKGKEECTLGSYGSEIVEDQKEFDIAIKEGFKESISDVFKEELAKDKKKKAPFKKDTKKDDSDDDF